MCCGGGTVYGVVAALIPTTGYPILSSENGYLVEYMAAFEVISTGERDIYVGDGPKTTA